MKIEKKLGGVRKGAGRPRIDEVRITLSMLTDEQTAVRFKGLASKLNLSYPKALRFLLDKHETE